MTVAWHGMDMIREPGYGALSSSTAPFHSCAREGGGGQRRIPWGEPTTRGTRRPEVTETLASAISRTAAEAAYAYLDLEVLNHGKPSCVPLRDLTRAPPTKSNRVFPCHGLCM